MHGLGGEAHEHVGEDVFDDKAVGDGETVGNGRHALHGQRLEGVADGVAQDEGAAQALLGGVGGHDAALDLDALLQESEQQVVIAGLALRHIVFQHVGKLATAGEHGVLDHFGIAGEHLVGGESAEVDG